MRSRVQGIQGAGYKEQGTRRGTRDAGTRSMRRGTGGVGTRRGTLEAGHKEWGTNFPVLIPGNLLCAPLPIPTKRGLSRLDMKRNVTRGGILCLI